MKYFLPSFLLLFSLQVFAQNHLEYGIKTGDETLFGIIDENGNEKTEAIYTDLTIVFINGKLRVKALINDKFGLLDLQGDYIIQPKFDSLLKNDCYKSKFIVVQKNSKWTYINEKGQNPFKMKFDSVGMFRNDTAVAYKNKTPYLLLSKGKKIKLGQSNINPESHFFTCYGEDIFLSLEDASITSIKYSTKNGKTGYGVYQSNKWIIEPAYDKIYLGHNSYFVSEKGKWAIFSMTGEKITNFKYDRLKILE